MRSSSSTPERFTSTRRTATTFFLSLPQQLLPAVVSALGRRMRYVYAGRKRAQLKAAKAAAAAQLASTLVEAAEAVGPEAATEADADVGGVMGDDVSIAPTEQVDAPDDSEGAAPLALALAQTDATETALRPVDAEGLTLQPSDNAISYKWASERTELS